MIDFLKNIYYKIKLEIIYRKNKKKSFGDDPYIYK